MSPDDMLEPATLPMRPWDYLRRRRLLAGKTIAQAARPFWHREEHRADCERNTAMMERPGYVMQPWLARDVPRSFAFDPEVYRQLTDLPLFHPTLCRCCGSTDAEPRETHDGFAGRIERDGICTACQEDRQRRELRKAAA